MKKTNFKNNPAMKKNFKLIDIFKNLIGHKSKTQATADTEHFQKQRHVQPKAEKEPVYPIPPDAGKKKPAPDKKNIPSADERPKTIKSKDGVAEMKETIPWRSFSVFPSLLGGSCSKWTVAIYD